MTSDDLEMTSEYLVAASDILVVSCDYLTVTRYIVFMTSPYLVGTRESLVVTCNSLVVTRYDLVRSFAFQCFLLSSSRVLITRRGVLTFRSKQTGTHGWVRSERG